MQLLFKREQTSNTWGQIHFRLHATAEFDEEEQALVKKYSMTHAVLISVPQPDLMRRSIVVGLLVFILTFCFFFFGIHYQLEIYVRVHPITNLLMSSITAGLIGMLYYHNKRETIYVRDLMYGRYFKCRSVIELARKEAYLQMITRYFRQVLESAKNWGGTETFPIEPLPPEEAKNTILFGPFLE